MFNMLVMTDPSSRADRIRLRFTASESGAFNLKDPVCREQLSGPKKHIDLVSLGQLRLAMLLAKVRLTHIHNIKPAYRLTREAQQLYSLVSVLA